MGTFLKKRLSFHVTDSMECRVLLERLAITRLVKTLPALYSTRCYHAVQNLWSSRLLSTNVKIKIYKTVILPVVLYGCETWSLTLSEGHRFRVFQNRVLWRIFGPKRDEVSGGWKKCIMRSCAWFVLFDQYY
jgi:hypothetical protein